MFYASTVFIARQHPSGLAVMAIPTFNVEVLGCPFLPKAHGLRYIGDWPNGIMTMFCVN